jgi:hypothetical protein
MSQWVLTHALKLYFSALLPSFMTASRSCTFFALNGLVGCGHMSGLMARRICPLALMKSDDRNPYQICELQAHVSQQVVFGLRWRPCRSSRLNALAKLQTVICATALWICLQEAVVEGFSSPRTAPQRHTDPTLGRGGEKERGFPRESRRKLYTNGMNE